MPGNIVVEASPFLPHWLGMCCLVMIASRTIMIPVAIMLHELGHLIVTRLERIPVLKYQIGNGVEFLAFRCFGLDWSFNTNMHSGGAVYIPRLIPTTDKNWRSIQRIVMAGPVTNFLCAAGFGILGLVSDAFLMQTLYFSLAYANWMLLHSAQNDYLMARTARRKDSEAMAGFYLEDAAEYKMC